MKTYIELKNTFGDKGLMDLALTHRSWVNENPGKRRSNERLEFLGDAVLEFIVSNALYQKFPLKEEGFLTALRAQLVNTISLSQVAINMDLGKYIYLSKGEEDGGGRENPSILANTTEAIIGALFLDKGTSGAETFIKDNILVDLEAKAKKELKDPKSLIQEIVQSKGFGTPKYRVLSEEGPDHAKVFTIEIVVDGQSLGTGAGKNKSEAAQSAAASALEKFL
ncbi:ribonuclease III [Candidatus Woesebacteria bacterium RIFCSPLOWO2_01_FULL_39_23]|uniref:Ribonuclease 3 n=1 Tax=Candidatus Woesebacteria bacterium RIFCSPHIGHO2_01_FULL_40_22 TaxID=1802499 RepID=A0A1F7YLH9_9BACT|nr:MAG: ribonuclease III [Candidatus Woesebacteria bacterium RBG_16_40_11]OGM27375.1 MAG: ribonuclease III [Candidatus Woesebacteria bacterium RIFCSPHIGHO2_01_FULL_40_22]OGM37266.1 MAG: ribonuclease III [Candidatus Woesebacteria bacterium RIFCSPHIGHO2_12_FULL_38_9]OGM62547.1 MAG: ribonuclease III [Candidatus Woesebacteria bacterium RIFCSPLOWO2_01_FULL_39_23]